jgi:hypothetical protein
MLSRRALCFGIGETLVLSILSWRFCSVVETVLVVAFLIKPGAPSSTVDQREIFWWREASQRRCICHWRTVTST